MLQESATFFINPTANTPFVEFSLQDGKLDIIGKCAPTSSPEFYRQIKSWIKECLSVVEHSLNVNISFEDCDISTNNDFFDLLKVLKAEGDRKEIFFNWYYYGYADHQQKHLISEMKKLGIYCTMYSYAV